MGYAQVPLIASCILVIHHVIFTDASGWSKSVLATIVIASIAIGQLHPQWGTFAMLAQVGASIYMLIYIRIKMAGALAADGDTGPLVK